MVVVFIFCMSHPSESEDYVKENSPVTVGELVDEFGFSESDVQALVYLGIFDEGDVDFSDASVDARSPPDDVVEEWEGGF